MPYFVDRLFLGVPLSLLSEVKKFVNDRVLTCVVIFGTFTEGE